MMNKTQTGLKRERGGDEMRIQKVTQRELSQDLAKGMIYNAYRKGARNGRKWTEIQRIRRSAVRRLVEIQGVDGLWDACPFNTWVAVRIDK